MIADAHLDLLLELSHRELRTGERRTFAATWLPLLERGGELGLERLAPLRPEAIGHVERDRRAFRFRETRPEGFRGTGDGNPIVGLHSTGVLLQVPTSAASVRLSVDVISDWRRSGVWKKNYDITVALGSQAQ